MSSKEMNTENLQLNNVPENFDFETEIQRLRRKPYSDYISEEELQNIEDTYRQMKYGGVQKWKLLRPIVPIKEWINSPYYLGASVYTIYPYWKKHVIEIFEREVRPTQIIITGSIGAGKTHISTLILLRIIYELSCYENIANLYKLDGVTRIALVYLSVTKDQAEQSGYTTLKAWLDTIPYFDKHFPRRKGIESMMIFPQENVAVTFGSVANHFIGMSVIAAVLDEANFKEGRQVDDADEKMNTKAASIFNQLKARAASRFVVNNRNYSMAILTSSTTSESSYTEEMIEKSIGNPLTYVMSPSLWDVKPQEYGKASDRFIVFAGGDGMDPYIVNDYRDINHLLELRKYPPITHVENLLELYDLVPYDLRQRLVKVPTVLRSEFEGDIVQALQDLAGFAVSSSGRFFTSNEAFNKVVDAEVPHPFTQDKIVLSTTDSSFQEGFMPLSAYLKPGFQFKNPSIPRFMHLDLSLTGDSTGIAMAHISGWRDLYERSPKEPQRYETGAVGQSLEIPYFDLQTGSKVPIITVDFMIEIPPPKKPNQISYGKIRDFVSYLHREMKVNIAKVTADQFQSAHILQEIKDLGIDSDRLSVDRDTKAYDTLASLIYENRIKIYDHPTFRSELFALIKYPAKRKIDHPLSGSKDIADAVAGAVYNAVLAMDKSDIGTQDMSNHFITANQSNDLESKMIEFAQNLMGSMGIPQGIKVDEWF